MALKSVEGAFTMCQDFCLINMIFYVHALSDPPRYPADFGARFHHSGSIWLVNYDVFPDKFQGYSLRQID